MVDIDGHHAYTQCRYCLQALSVYVCVVSVHQAVRLGWASYITQRVGSNQTAGT